jgi:intein-encoded DNA endonuclease-like protein
MATEYVLIRDDDAHWYVIPDGKQKAFYKWVDDLEMDVPEWIFEVGGSPQLIKFKEWRRE